MFSSYFKLADAREMHFTFYLGDSGRIGLNLQFKSDVKSARFHVAVRTQINKFVFYFIIGRNVKFGCSEC